MFWDQIQYASREPPWGEFGQTYEFLRKRLETEYPEYCLLLQKYFSQRIDFFFVHAIIPTCFIMLSCFFILLRWRFRYWNDGAS
jgi:hypothetical protein